MGAKYTTQSTSGYNASPPPDDGSQSASNLVAWSTHKTKLTDPLKTFGEGINTALVAALNTSVRQIASADSSVAGDHLRTIEIAPTVSNTITVSLGDASTMTTTYLVAVRNSSTISQIISRVTAGDKIDGVAGNITIPSKSTIYFTTNSVPDGYLSLSRFGPMIDTDPIVVGSADGTKKIRFEVDGLTTGTTRVLTVADLDSAIGKQPTRQTFLSGSGTYTTPAGATRIYIRLIGGGGGGGGSGTGAPTGGGTGGNTTFSTLAGNGGSGGSASGSAASSAGGTASNGDLNIPGGSGGGASTVATATQPGCSGTSGPFGGAGPGDSAGSPGIAGVSNTGSGGGGGGGNTGVAYAGGGATGGYVEKTITAPAATYSYGVGAVGSAGGAGTSGFAGGAGGTGVVIVDEFYN